MAHKVRYTAGIIAIGLVAFASCKKNSDDSAKARLTGKWKRTKFATDLNGNGSIDANETTPEPDSITFSIMFNSDGSATTQEAVSGVDQGSSTFNWKLTNNDKDLVLSLAGSSDTVHIESLTSTDLEISGERSNIGGTYKFWTFFHKQ